jgi:hypothetical protein
VIWGLATIGRSSRVDVLIRGLSVALLAGATVAIPLAFP